VTADDAASWAAGTVTRDGERSVLRYERHLRHPVEAVWAAVTEPDQLVAWLAEAELEPRGGGKVVLSWLNTDTDGSRAIAVGTVGAWQPPRVLELDTDIHGRLRFELSPEPGGCRLVFTCVLELPEAYRTKVLAGWHVHLEFLAEALDGARVDWPNWPFRRWETIHDRYIAAGDPRSARAGGA
jgi:uncharacterized protein YndB with AHSA1/START domain